MGGRTGRLLPPPVQLAATTATQTMPMSDGPTRRLPGSRPRWLPRRRRTTPDPIAGGPDAPIGACRRRRPRHDGEGPGTVSAMSRMRLGVAMLVPGSTRCEVDGLRRALGDGAQRRIPAHITLVPPVNVNSARLDEALAQLRQAASSVGSLRLELGPVATFWPATPVLYLRVGGDLEGLGRLRDAVFAGPLARPLSRPFVPHVTLAEDVDPDRIPGLVAGLDRYRASVTIERVHLLRESGTRIWEAIADAGLDRPAIIGRGGLEVEVRAAEELDPEEGAFLGAAWDANLARLYGALPAASPFAVVIRREGAIVAAATGESDDELRVDRLVVDAANSHQGIGTHLLRGVERVGMERGCRRAVLVCPATSAPWCADRGWGVAVHLPSWAHGADFVQMVKCL